MLATVAERRRRGGLMQDRLRATTDLFQLKEKLAAKWSSPCFGVADESERVDIGAPWKVTPVAGSGERWPVMIAVLMALVLGGDTRSAPRSINGRRTSDSVARSVAGLARVYRRPRCVQFLRRGPQQPFASDDRHPASSRAGWRGSRIERPNRALSPRLAILT